MTQHTETIIAICGGIVAIIGAIKAIYSLIKPIQDLCNRLDKTEDIIEQYESYFSNDKQAIIQLREISNDMLLLQLAQLNHSIDGNGIENMKKLRTDITKKIGEMYDTEHQYP